MRSKQKRGFRSLIAGFKLGKHLGETSRFLTLSTSDIQRQNVDYKGLNYSFKLIVSHIRRLTINTLLKEGYLKPSEVRYYYGNYPRNKPFQFEYFSVRTDEGNGVLHCPYRGNFIPYAWLVDTWNDIHNSWHVSIEQIHNNDQSITDITYYIVSQYIGGQGSSYQRSSRSKSWLFPRATKIWNTLVYQYSHDKQGYPIQINRELLLSRWDEIIKYQALERQNTNYKLDDYF